MVELREITSANLEDVLNLQIFEYQDKFVSSTAHALAQAYVYHETAFPFACKTFIHVCRICGNRNY